MYLTHNVDLRQARFCPEWFALRKTGWHVLFRAVCVFSVPRVKNNFHYCCGSIERLEKIGKLKGGYHG